MVGYFGSKGDHLRVSRNLNQFVERRRGPIPRLSADSPILPGSALGNITEVTSIGYSRYDALWITLNRRFSGGPAAQRLLHALGVEGHELPQLAGRGGAGQHQRRRATTRPPTTTRATGTC